MFLSALVVNVYLPLMSGILQGLPIPRGLLWWPGAPSICPRPRPPSPHFSHRGLLTLPGTGSFCACHLPSGIPFPHVFTGSFLHLISSSFYSQTSVPTTLTQTAVRPLHGPPLPARYCVNLFPASLPSLKFQWGQGFVPMSPASI